MARVAVIGEPLRIYGYGLAGAVMFPASDQAEAISAWRELPDDVSVAVLTPSAARWLACEIATRPRVLPVLLPEARLVGPVSPEAVLPEAVLPEAVLPGEEPAEPGLREPGLREPGLRDRFARFRPVRPRRPT